MATVISETTSTLPTSDEATDRPWLVSPGWDTFWLFCGLWLIGLVMLADAFGKGSGANYRLTMAGWILVWGGHIMSPMIGAWSSPALRQDLYAQRNRYIVFPAVLFLVAVVAGVFFGEGAADAAPFLMVNYQFTGLGTIVLFTFIFWNVWHFAAQHFGILSIYRARRKQFSPRDRAVDRWFTIIMTCGLVTIAWYTQGKRLGAILDVLPLPDPRGFVAYGVVVLSVVLTAGMIAYELRKPNRSVPKVIYILSIGVQPIIGVLAYSVYHFAAYAMAHWLIAIGLSARVTSNAAASRGADRGAGWQSWFLVHVALLFAVSFVLYIAFRSSVIPAVYAAVSPHGADGINNVRMVGLIAGAGVGISFVHFIYDRYLYSFHRPIIREHVSGNLFR